MPGCCRAQLPTLVWRLGGSIMTRTDLRYTGHLYGPKMARLKLEGLSTQSKPA